MKQYVNKLKFLFGFIILFALFQQIGFGEIYNVLLTMNPVFLIPILVITFLNFAIGALNIKVLLIPLESKIPFFKIFKYKVLGWSLGLFAPGKMGELSLIYFLSKERIAYGQGTVVSLLDRLISLLCISLLAILGFYLFFTSNQTLYLVLFLLLVFSALSYLLSKNGRGMIKKYLLRGYSTKFEGFSKTFFDYLKNRKRLLFLNLVLTMSMWIINSLAVFLTFLSFGQRISFFYIILITAMTILISLIPITFSGLGLKEASAAFLYAIIGINYSTTISVYIVLGVLNYLLSVFFIVLWFDEFKEIKKMFEY